MGELIYGNPYRYLYYNLFSRILIPIKSRIRKPDLTT